MLYQSDTVFSKYIVFVSMSITCFSDKLMGNLLRDSKSTCKFRQHLNVHKSYHEPCQRLFNAICMDSYIRPHRHLLDRKTECLIAVRGMMALIVFDDKGEVIETIRFGTEKFYNETLGCCGVELSPETWHTVISINSESILFEVKSGPFEPALAKELAAWAPEEKSQESMMYLSKLHELVASDTCYPKSN